MSYYEDAEDAEDAEDEKISNFRCIDCSIRGCFAWAPHSQNDVAPILRCKARRAEASSHISRYSY